jgi:hypothetical protein
MPNERELVPLGTLPRPPRVRSRRLDQAEQIHPDFWRKIAAERQHLEFDDRNYKSVAKDLCAKVLALRQKRGQ